MAFRVRNKHGRGGRRPGAGRPTKEQAAQKESLRQAIERKREELANAFSNAYLGMALNDPATMRHLVDKLIPDAKQERDEQQQPLQITFLQFSRNRAQPGQNSSEPWTGPSEVKSPILVSDNRNGDEWGGQGVAPVKLQFANFSNGKRRK